MSMPKYHLSIDQKFLIRFSVLPIHTLKERVITGFKRSPEELQGHPLPTFTLKSLLPKHLLLKDSNQYPILTRLMLLAVGLAQMSQQPESLSVTLDKTCLSLEGLFLTHAPQSLHTTSTQLRCFRGRSGRKAPKNGGERKYCNKHKWPIMTPSLPPVRHF